VTAVHGHEHTHPVVEFTVRGQHAATECPTCDYTVIYDGMCKVCTRLANVLRNWDRRHLLDVVSSQAPGVMARFPWIPPLAFAEALQFKQATRVSLSYLETARMARFAAGLVQQQGQLGLDEEQAVARLMTTVGRGAIVSTTNADGRRFEMTTHVPHSAIAGVASLNGALWRIALSPLVNPPMMPPMPVPPPHVTPQVNRATDGSL